MAHQDEENSLYDVGRSLLQDAWDTGNVDAVVNHFCEDTCTGDDDGERYPRWYVNASDPVVGRQAIRDFAPKMMAATKSSRHDDFRHLVSLKEKDEGATTTATAVVVVQGSVTYELLPSSEGGGGGGQQEEILVKCVFCDVFDMIATGSGEYKIKTARTYLDTSPLLQK